MHRRIPIREFEKKNSASETRESQIFLPMRINMKKLCKRFSKKKIFFCSSTIEFRMIIQIGRINRASVEFFVFTKGSMFSMGISFFSFLSIPWDFPCVFLHAVICSWKSAFIRAQTNVIGELERLVEWRDKNIYLLRRNNAICRIDGKLFEHTTARMVPNQRTHILFVFLSRFFFLLP